MSQKAGKVLGGEFHKGNQLWSGKSHICKRESESYCGCTNQIRDAKITKEKEGEDSERGFSSMAKNSQL